MRPINRIRPHQLSLRFCLAYSANLSWLVWLSLSLICQIFRLTNWFLLAFLLHLALFHSPIKPYIQRYFSANQGFFRWLISGWLVNALASLWLLSASILSHVGAATQTAIGIGLLALGQLCLMAAILSPLSKLLRSVLQGQNQ